MQNISCFLLSYVKYGDHDAILHCFTEDSGYQSYFAKGIYAARNKKKAYLLPLNELNIFINPASKNKSIQNITRIELCKNRDLYTKIKSNAVIFFVADFLNQILKLESGNALIYQEIERFLEKVEKENHQAHLFFMFSLLEIIGFSPLLSSEKYLNPENGNFESAQFHPIFNEKISEIWRNLSAVENPYFFKINSTFRKVFQDSLLLYYKYHISDFKTPKSLEILQQIFD